MLNAEQLVQAFVDAGYDTPEKVTLVLKTAGPYVMRQQLSYALDAAIIATRDTVAKANANEDVARQVLAAADAALLPR